jgi:predicted ATP-dependent serine protease
MSPEITGVQGSVSQVREVTAELLQIAKTNNIATFIVGHVTKEGSLAGPRMLEHMVDTVLYFEGERQHTFRILRAVKIDLARPMKLGFLRCNLKDSLKSPIQVKFFRRTFRRGNRFSYCRLYGRDKTNFG